MLISVLEYMNKQCTGSFTGSCSNIQLLDSTTLQASCSIDYDSESDSQLNLDEHISNQNGTLVCTSGQGSFSLSCTGVTLLGMSQLSAQCRDMSSFVQSASLDLDVCVQNSNGKLSWACIWSRAPEEILRVLSFRGGAISSPWPWPWPTTTRWPWIKCMVSYVTTCVIIIQWRHCSISLYVCIMTSLWRNSVLGVLNPCDQNNNVQLTILGLYGSGICISFGGSISCHHDHQ